MGILNGKPINIDLLKDQDNKKPGVAFCTCMVNAVPLADFCSEQKPGVDDCKMGGDTAPSVRTILSTCIVHQTATREAGKFKIKEADVAMTCKQNLATTTVAATTAAATTASATVPETEATTAAPVKTNTLSTIDQLKKEVTIAKALVLKRSKELTIAKKRKESADSKYVPTPCSHAACQKRRHTHFLHCNPRRRPWRTPSPNPQLIAICPLSSWACTEGTVCTDVQLWVQAIALI